MAQRRAQGRRHGRDPHQRQLPARTLRTPTLPHRPQQSDRCRQALDARRRLAHAHHRRDLRRSRPRLLPPPRPHPHDQAPRRPARTPRTHRHAPGGSRIGRERIFPSVGVIAVAGPPVVILAGPWLLFGLVLAGPFAVVLTLVVLLGAAAALVGLIRAILAG